SSSASVNSTGATKAFIVLLPYIVTENVRVSLSNGAVVAPPRELTYGLNLRSNIFLKWYENKYAVFFISQELPNACFPYRRSKLFEERQLNRLALRRQRSSEAEGLFRVEFAVLARDKIVGEREARHGLQTPRPGFEMRPIRDVEAALGHEHHAAPAADIGYRALLADQPLALLQRLVD